MVTYLCWTCSAVQCKLGRPPVHTSPPPPPAFFLAGGIHGMVLPCSEWIDLTPDSLEFTLHSHMHFPICLAHHHVMSATLTALQPMTHIYDNMCGWPQWVNLELTTKAGPSCPVLFLLQALPSNSFWSLLRSTLSFCYCPKEGIQEHATKLLQSVKYSTSLAKTTLQQPMVSFLTKPC